MTLERVEKIEAESRETLRQETPAADAGTEAAPSSLRQWLRLVAMRRSANGMLRRLLHRPIPTRIDELSPHPLRDLGLPPDIRH